MREQKEGYTRRPAPRSLPARLAASALGVCGASLDRTADSVGDASRVMRFLRGRLEFAPRPDDIYAVTYPRSGTTWVQFILHLLTTDGRTDFAHISEVTPWFERSLALGTRRARDFEALPSQRVFKSHLPYRWLPGQGRCIYVARDGMDVLTSYFNFYRTHLRFEGSFEQFYERFMEGRLQYRSWFRHVEGWRQQEGNPRVLLLRYEDLASDLQRSVGRIARFCGLRVSPEKTREVLHRASFDFMKEHEEQFDPITEHLMDQGLVRGAFLRRGLTGEGRATLTPQQEDRFRQELARRRRRPDLELDLPAFLH